MKIGIIGSNGRVGSRVVKEAEGRGHSVLRISPEGEADIKKSLWDLQREDLKEIDVLISAFGTWTDQSLHLKVAEHLDKLMVEVDKPWYVVGGAGSLYVSETQQLLDTDTFPKEYYEVAYGMKLGLDYLQEKGKSDWSYFSPSAAFEPGEKTGKYRLGKDNLLVNNEGESYISMEDYATVMIDVIESKKFIRERFTAVQG